MTIDPPPHVTEFGESGRVETATVEANGLTFTVDLAGRDGAELVLFLHGFPQTRYAWRGEMAAVAGAGFRAAAPDQRGYSHGARPVGVDAYRIEELVGDALAIADALAADRFHLVGHDWGGHLAWIIAALHADRVTSLAVLSRPHPAAFARAMKSDAAQSTRSSHHASFQRAEATDELLADDAASLRALYRRAGVPSADAAVYLTTLGERPALDAAINWYRAGGGSGLRASDVASITVPTLYVWGDADTTVGRAAAEATAAQVEGRYRFVELAGVGHFVTDEAPLAFPPLLLEHLGHEDVSR